jgi:hypothetical protein
MYLRRTEREKDGESHSCRSIVEKKRVSRCRMMQRHVPYLGEIRSSRAAAWHKGHSRCSTKTPVLREPSPCSQMIAVRSSPLAPLRCDFACPTRGCAVLGNVGWPGRFVPQAGRTVQVKLLAEDGELHVFAQNLDRVIKAGDQGKERAVRRCQLTWLQKIATMEVSHEEVLMNLGVARSKRPAPRQYRARQADRRLHFLDHKKLQNRTTPRGTPSVHSNLTDSDPPALAVLHPARRDGGGDQQP